jgi:hypothetical protein
MLTFELALQWVERRKPEIEGEAYGELKWELHEKLSAFEIRAWEASALKIAELII